jgi:putative addiction module CopG family antidote
MTIHLPEDLQRYVQSAVRNGHFTSEEEVITEAVRLLRQRDEHAEEAEPQADKDVVPETPQASRKKPIWEVAEELSQSIPQEEWAKLPIDGAQQLDHYIYGSPKRPTS